MRVVFETHSFSLDNDAGRASGWRHSALSENGRSSAQALGARRRNDGIAVVFCSDLRRAAETAEIAFAGTDVPILHDWRLRECDYGAENGGPASVMHAGRADHIDVPYPGGESWREAVARVCGFLRELPTTRWRDTRVLIVGHMATRWGLQHHAGGVSLEECVNEHFEWQEGWEYDLPA